MTESKYISESGWYLISLNTDEILSTKVNNVTQVDKQSTITNAYLVDKNKQNEAAPSFGEFTNSNWESVSSNYTATSSLGIWVYVTVVDFDDWQERFNPESDNTLADNFGESISLNGDGTIMAVGAPSANSDIGYVKIFKNTNGTWGQYGLTLVGDTGSGSVAEFGKSVSLNEEGNILAVGSPAFGTTGGVNRGQVNIYQFNSSSSEWEDKGNSPILGPVDTNLSFGQSVALNAVGDTEVIGAPLEDSDDGTAYIYKFINDVWTQFTNKIEGNIVVDSDFFGDKVDIDSTGNKLLISTRNNYVMFYTYSLESNSYDLEYSIAVSGTDLDISLSSNGKFFAIGDKGTNRRVVVYESSTGTEIDSLSGAIGVGFGHSVALNSDASVLAIGAYDSVNNITGFVQIRNFISNAYLPVDNTISGNDSEYLGSSVALNSNGNIVAIGAIGDNTNNKSSAYIFSPGN